MFSNLPVELIDIILSYEGSLRNRNGKWMNQLDLPKEIKEKISKCIQRKYNSKYPNPEKVEWSVNIHTHKRLSLYIRKESYSHVSNTEYKGDYRIISYKEGVIIMGGEKFKSMLVDKITTYNFIW